MTRSRPPLLITVAVFLVPLLTYTVEDMLGLWPAERPGAYGEFYPRVHASWIVMEVATMAAALVALRFVPFGFLTAPLAYSFWFFSIGGGVAEPGRPHRHSGRARPSDLLRSHGRGRTTS
jgi:hypothetical protein